MHQLDPVRPWLLIAALFAMPAAAVESPAAEPRSHQWPIDIVTETFGYDAATPTDYPWADVYQGCGRRDCIASIDQPRFIAADEAGFLDDDDLVLAVSHQGVIRAYPTRILDFHEIVNDSVAGEPIAISYCPLCGSGLAFSRVLEGQVLEFGVSGLLHNSDLIMYDRASESLWQQIEGAAFAGPLRGAKLKDFPMVMTTWREWRSAHPDTQVLSTETGHAGLPYAGTPHYRSYQGSDRIMFPVAARDARLHPKRVIYGVEIDGTPIAYDADYLKERGRLSERMNGRVISVIYQPDGTVEVSEADSGKSWIPKRMFWFAWYTFHPGTRLRDATTD